MRQITIEIVDSLLSCNLCQNDFDEVENIETPCRRHEEYFLNPIPIPSSDAPSKFIDVKSFLGKYCWSDCSELKNRVNPSPDSFNLQDLLDCFVEVTFKPEVNVKDCY